MKHLTLDFYHRLPAPLRTLAGTLYGHYIGYSRYGRGFEALVQSALERDSWSTCQWDAWQAKAIRDLLARAAVQVPFYRHFWSQHPGVDQSVLENWPVVEKEQVRERPADFLVDVGKRRHLYEDHTSGTTGTPLRVWSSRETLNQWYALFEARGRRWYGVSRHDRWAILGGRLVKPVREKNPPYWIWNSALRQLYMSSYHLAPDHIGHYLDALAKYHIRYIYGYTSALYDLAVEANRQGRRDVTLHVAIANAEPVFPYQRRAIEAAFGCPLRETYGMAEMCGGASECEARGLHLWPEAGVMEVLDGFTPVAPGESGDLVCTGLVNRDMLLIRYRVGDRGALLPGQECECGRRLPLLSGIDGRCDDMLYSPHGERVGRLDPVFKDDLPIKMAQIIQESLAEVRLRYVPAAGFRDEHKCEIARQIRARLGEVAVTFDEVTDIPRTASGKFRAVICKLSAPEKEGISGRIP